MMGKNEPSNIGKVGEEIAGNYLIKKGYVILEKNFRYGHGEIDIIAKDGETLVFVEVKTKKHGDFGDPLYWISRKKQLQIGKIARAYLYQKGIDEIDCRFDVITLQWEKGSYKIEHLQDAFWA